MIDFMPTPEQLALKQRVEQFIRRRVIPFESDLRIGPHGPRDDLRIELNALARNEGLLSPQVDRRYGGMGLSHLDRAIVFEAAGYSLLGPIAMHCAAPDEGNMHLLEAVADPAQKERWLSPLAIARVRSCFAMTEPAPGAGADPRQLATVARHDAGHYVVTGGKWLITGAQGAAFTIVMANVVDGPKGTGPTMLLADMNTPGLRIERVIDSLDQSFVGGHAQLTFNQVRIPADQVLGAVGEGLRYAQVRLAPARLTHCMRWLGAAQRAHDIASIHAGRRTAFGKPIGEHEGVSFMLADNEVDLHLSRLATWHVAWLLDRGERAGRQSSIAKLAVSEALYRVADRCVQVLGGLGVTRDTVVERIFRELRAFRIYDGPSEVHRWSIGRAAVKAGTEAA